MHRTRADNGAALAAAEEEVFRMIHFQLETLSLLKWLLEKFHHDIFPTGSGKTKSGITMIFCLIEISWNDKRTLFKINKS